jgi:pimeloyl-ACP methyl ester carboxylesterase
MLFARLLQEALDALALPAALLIGNSVGGYAAARLAIDRPERVRGLVLVSPGGFTPHNFISRLFCRIKGSEWVTAHSNRAFAALYLRRRTPVVRDMLERAAGEQRRADAVAVNAAVWRSFIEPEHDLRQRAATIQAPTLVVSGRLDPVIPAGKDGRIAAASIPGARQVVLETGHAPFAEDPQAFLAAVEPFLDGVAGKA